MSLNNLLDIGITIFGQTREIELSWIGGLIKGLIEGVGSVGVGVILFSIILKLIVMPFDVMQRVSMRKQNAKMEQNKEKMERLQKQYANNKELYNQKVQEMYKKEGISMLSSCLPTILSLVIFIVAINNFTAYSQYADVHNYNLLVNQYNEKLMTYTVSDADVDASFITETTVGEKAFVKVEDDDKFVYYLVAKPDTAYTPQSIVATARADRNYFINVEKVKANATLNAAVSALVSVPDTDATYADAYAQACKDYLMGEAQTAAYEAYQSDVKGNTAFLWIKNIWATDASFKSPVLEYSEFKTAIAQNAGGCGGCGSCGSCGTAENAELTGDPYDESTYNIVTAKLSAEKNAANGYYILIVLSIGTILLQQFLSMRANKAQNQYSSVDGQGAMSQKTMMIMMTVMFAVFSFMYSAAFSVYLVVGNLLSMVSTIVINALVDRSLHKKEEAALQAKYNQRFPGRKSENDNKKK